VKEEPKPLPVTAQIAFEGDDNDKCDVDMETQEIELTEA
jgi:hypothetical protein